MRRVLAVFCLAVSCAALVPQLDATVVYRSGEGWSAESSNGEDRIESTASAQIQKAEDYEEHGDLKRAMKAYHGLVRKFPNSGVASKSQFKYAELAEKLGDYDRAFDAYGVYLSKYPKGEDFDHAVEAQFNIAKRFLEGERRRLFGMKTFSSMERAQAMFESIVKNAPFSRFAAQAQFYAGQALEKQGKNAEALAAYQAVLSRYASDPIAADAQYQIGYVHFKIARSAFDKAEANKAREAFEDYLAHFPGSEKAPQAQENLKTLGGRETGTELETARFYDKQKNYKAAVIYYNDVIKQNPDSDAAKIASSRIAELKNKVGEDVLRAGPDKAETGARAAGRRKLQAQVDTASRADFNGPPVSMPTPQPPADESAPGKPKLRTAPQDIGTVPAVEPTLPSP